MFVIRVTDESLHVTISIAKLIASGGGSEKLEIKARHPSKTTANFSFSARSIDFGLQNFFCPRGNRRCHKILCS